MVRVKICGITNMADAENAISFGADALGFVFAESPRKISKEKAASIIDKVPPFITCVGLFVDEAVDTVNEICKYCNINTIQFHGNENEDYIQKFVDFKIIKAIRVRTELDVLQINDINADAYLLDSYSKKKMGGTGESFNWQFIQNAGKLGVDSGRLQRVVLAGGLNPNNVSEAIKITSPFAVDVSSGVEKEPGVKCKDLLQKFIFNAKTYSKGSGF